MQGAESARVSSVRLLSGLLLCLGLTLTAGCSDQTETRPPPDVLRVGVLPDERGEALLQRYTPLLEYLSSELGIPYTLRIPNDYAALLDDFAEGRVDLAYFGGVTFIRAFESHGAVPVVVRDIDLRFTSYFFALGGSPTDQIRDYADETFTFGSRLSTSGHLMPRYFLQSQGIIPEDFFSEVQYSRSHDDSAFAVRDGKAALGVANSSIIDAMLSDGRLEADSLRIIWETPPYADYVWAVRPDLDASTRDRILAAFLALEPDESADVEILSAMDAGGFLPASLGDFAPLVSVYRQSPLAEKP